MHWAQHANNLNPAPKIEKRLYWKFLSNISAPKTRLLKGHFCLGSVIRIAVAGQELGIYK